MIWVRGRGEREEGGEGIEWIINLPGQRHSDVRGAWQIHLSVCTNGPVGSCVKFAPTKTSNYIAHLAHTCLAPRPHPLTIWYWDLIFYPAQFKLLEYTRQPFENICDSLVQKLKIIHFDCSILYKAPHCWNFVKRMIEAFVCYTCASDLPSVSPNLSASLVIQCFKCGNEIKIHYEIIFDDLLQLSHPQVLYTNMYTHYTILYTHYLRHFPYLRRYSCMHNWLKYTVHRLLADRLSLRCFFRFYIRCFHRHLLRWSLKMAAYHLTPCSNHFF